MLLKKILPDSLPSPKHWNISNKRLKYSMDNTIAVRKCTLSASATAVANLPSNHCAFAVIIQSTPEGSNLAFGLAPKGFSSSSVENSVGRKSGSWGICDCRDLGKALIYEDGRRGTQNYRKKVWGV
jgi:hypothetical protein